MAAGRVPPETLLALRGFVSLIGQYGELLKIYAGEVPLIGSNTRTQSTARWLAGPKSKRRARMT
ncbi:MAG: hypothetical protein WD733_26460 [Bryobacterales bacterium]